jgi:hypothetical protein
MRSSKFADPIDSVSVVAIDTLSGIVTFSFVSGYLDVGRMSLTIKFVESGVKVGDVGVLESVCRGSRNHYWHFRKVG